MGNPRPKLSKDKLQDLFDEAAKNYGALLENANDLNDYQRKIGIRQSPTTVEIDDAFFSRDSDRSALKGLDRALTSLSGAIQDDNENLTPDESKDLADKVDDLIHKIGESQSELRTLVDFKSQDALDQRNHDIFKSIAKTIQSFEETQAKLVSLQAAADIALRDAEDAAKEDARKKVEALKKYEKDLEDALNTFFARFQYQIKRIGKEVDLAALDLKEVPEWKRTATPGSAVGGPARQITMGAGKHEVKVEDPLINYKIFTYWFNYWSKIDIKMDTVQGPGGAPANVKTYSYHFNNFRHYKNVNMAKAMLADHRKTCGSTAPLIITSISSEYDIRCFLEAAQALDCKNPIKLYEDPRTKQSPLRDKLALLDADLLEKFENWSRNLNEQKHQPKEATHLDHEDEAADEKEEDESARSTPPGSRRPSIAAGSEADAEAPEDGVVAEITPEAKTPEIRVEDDRPERFEDEDSDTEEETPKQKTLDQTEIDLKIEESEHLDEAYNRPNKTPEESELRYQREVLDEYAKERSAMDELCAEAEQPLDEEDSDEEDNILSTHTQKDPQRTAGKPTSEERTTVSPEEQTEQSAETRRVAILAEAKKSNAADAGKPLSADEAAARKRIAEELAAQRAKKGNDGDEKDFAPRGHIVTRGTVQKAGSTHSTGKPQGTPVNSSAAATTNRTVDLSNASSSRAHDKKRDPGIQPGQPAANAATALHRPPPLATGGRPTDERPPTASREVKNDMGAGLGLPTQGSTSGKSDVPPAADRDRRRSTRHGTQVPASRAGNFSKQSATAMAQHVSDQGERRLTADAQSRLKDLLGESTAEAEAEKAKKGYKKGP